MIEEGETANYEFDMKNASFVVYTLDYITNHMTQTDLEIYLTQVFIFASILNILLILF